MQLHTGLLLIPIGLIASAAPQAHTAIIQNLPPEDAELDQTRPADEPSLIAAPRDSNDVAAGERGGPCFDTILWNQAFVACPSCTGRVAQAFPDAPQFSTYQFDDFEIPTTECWFISRIIATGTEQGSPAFNESVVAQIWNGLPGQGHIVLQSLNGFQNGHDLVLDFPPNQPLPPGRYWLTAYVQRPFNPGGQWFWNATTPVALNEEYFWNPGGGFGYGTQPVPGSVVFSTANDMSFTICGTTICWGCTVTIVTCPSLCVDEAGTFTAEGFCPGGTCEWSFSPPDRVEIISQDNCSITVRGANPSLAVGDVTAEVTYYCPDGGIAMDSCNFTVADVDLSGPDLLCLGDTGTYTATGKPAGGECEWSVEYAGDGRVSLAPDECSCDVTGTAASQPKNDITIKVKYTIAGIECRDEQDMTVARLQTTRIKFDHTGPNTNLSDGLNIRKNWATDLDHGSKDTNGEWIKGSRNEEVLYVANQTVTCKVRFTVKPTGIASARIKANATGDIFGNLAETAVAFDAAGVSTPEYVEMSFDAPTDNFIDKDTGTFEWSATEIDGKAVGPCRFDDSGPHVMYFALEAPKSPWYDTEKEHPWVSALEFTIITANTLYDSTREQATSTVSTFVHSGYGLKYDTTSGAPRYASNGKGSIKFDMTRFMTKAKGVIVNCYDCAAAVVCMSTLVGVPTEYKFMQPFGYILKTALIGRGDCDNPFPKSGGGVIDSLCVDGVPGSCAAGATCVSDCISPKRRSFGNHAFVELAGKIFDACAGPHLGTEAPADYVASSIDKSTAAEGGGGVAHIKGGNVLTVK